MRALERERERARGQERERAMKKEKGEKYALQLAAISHPPTKVNFSELLI